MKNRKSIAEQLDDILKQNKRKDFKERLASWMESLDSLSRQALKAAAKELEK